MANPCAARHSDRQSARAFMTGARTRWTGRKAMAVLAVALVAAAGAVLLASEIRRAPETYPWGDAATTSIYAIRAARGNLSVGAYSRFRWNHPGPLLYELLAPLYAASGYRGASSS
jgi:hypothetical protein